MAEYTPGINLYKPNVNDEIDVHQSLSENFTKIDESLADIAINVKRSYGAKGDGVTDDTLAIQNALNQASANGGGVVLLPNTGNSVYMFTTLTIPAKVTLEMQPAGIYYDTALRQPHCLKRITGQVGYGLIFQTYSAAKNVVVEGNNSGHGVDISSNCQIEGLYVFRTGGRGIRIGGVCIVNRVHTGYCAEFGIELGQSDSNISNIFSYGNGWGGLYAGTGIANTSITNGKIEWNNGTNISLYQCDNIYFNNINIDRADTSGLRLAGASKAFFNNCRFWRNYKSATIPAEGRAHILIDGGGNRLYLNNCSMQNGKNDDLTGNDTPEYGVTGWGDNTSKIYSSCLDAENGYITASGFFAPYSGTSITHTTSSSVIK